jgi:hypothetical protein
LFCPSKSPSRKNPYLLFLDAPYRAFGRNTGRDFSPSFFIGSISALSSDAGEHMAAIGHVVVTQEKIAGKSFHVEVPGNVFGHGFIVPGYRDNDANAGERQTCRVPAMKWADLIDTMDQRPVQRKYRRAGTGTLPPKRTINSIRMDDSPRL